jgi:hypothetical protein
MPNLIVIGIARHCIVVKFREYQPVNDRFMNDIRKKVGKAAQALRENRMLAAPSKEKCAACDYHGLCTAGSKIYHRRG